MIADTNPDDLIPKDEQWLDQWYRVTRWLKKVRDIKDKSRVKELTAYDHDDLIAFFQNCFHLSDWIKAAHPILKNKLKDFFSANFEMKACRNICDGYSAPKRISDQGIPLPCDGANMTQIDAAGILDIAMAGTSATLLARKWESALLVNVDNDTLRRILENPEAMAAVERIEGWRSLGDNIIETIINKSEKVKELKNKARDRDLAEKEKKYLTAEEKEYKSKRKLVQEKLIKFATRIPAFMYLTDFRENTLQDVITKLEPDLFLAVTGLTVKEFHLLVRLNVFNTEQMNQAVFAFRRYEDASLRYTGIDSHPGLTHYGLYDTVVARE